MTQAEWNECVDPVRMLAFLEGTHSDGQATPERGRGLSERKRRLFACAWWRTMLPHNSHHEKVCVAVEAHGRYKVPGGVSEHTVESLLRSCMSDGDDRQGTALLREIAGNPFRRTTLRFPLPWLVRNMAGRIYDERDWEALPILADALEDAGAYDAALLDHLRSGGIHVRGCWSLDLILGLE